MTDGRLNILFRRPALGAGVGLGVVARVQSLSAAGAPTRIETVVPVGAQESRTVTVPPGAYAVQLVLPSGRMLQEVREVASDQDVEVVFEAEPPTHEWLAWQAFESGRAPASPATRRDSAVESPDPPFGINRFRAADRLLRGLSQRGPRAFRLQPTPQAADMWALTPEAVRGAPGRSLGAAPEAEGSLSMWRFGAHGLAAEHDWLRVQTQHALELVRLPCPWMTPVDLERAEASAAQVPVEVLVDDTQGYERAATSISVNDPRMGGLLAYLDRGRLGAVRPLVEHLDSEGLITAVIRDKMLNPFAACAAAYVGLAVFEPGEAERWDSWLPNIMQFHSWLPDAAIVHARRITLRPSAVDETEALRDVLKRAYRAGVPFFTAGVELLRGMLQSQAQGWPEGERMLAAVARTAQRLDRSQAFTVLRYPKGVANAP